MVLTPPTLPKIAVPGGLSKWSKRLKQPTDNAFRDNINVIKPKATRTTNQHASPPKAKDSNSSKSFAPAKPPPQSDDSLFETSYQLSNDRAHQTVVLRAIVKRIDKYLRRKRMRVIDLFRYCDFDHCGYITPGGMEEVLRQMDIRLPPAEMEMFMMHLDTNKNGVIDVDEFESLVRVHRRTDARRDQLRQELPHVLKLDPVSASPAPSHSSSIVPSSLLALKDQVLHAAHALDPDATGTVAAAPLAKAIGGLTVPKIPSDVVESFVAMCRPLHGLVVVADIERVLAGPIGKGGKKGNRFLDHTWLGQFDAQMEKVRGLGS
ncbi:hypothetical protein H310_00359 [Aphanomyces invadans]|uniref:EF-hand domain-containing protein n=1 Tax=Aphanomyces invadans TaxID=157072 RepID=A0A024UTV7_9STRA|nr:hypothetical protein H310_00359 [Aphanomyces invadans]ETW09931.1 hypothetical protein H310_00359 [Aphanomyces invadans]|eukprot:XP_008861342.1 hypothetical protein H310_00359 [Aphanomyces invadans]